MQRMSMLQELLIEGVDDLVSASWVYSSTIERVGDFEDDRRTLAVGVIAELIDMGLMVPGSLSDGGFREWNQSKQESILRIVHQWATRGNVEPISNEIVWLAITEKGRAVAKAIAN